ncbi:MAG: hypothetical protein C0392_03545 [Syntrophus sp. (in: bacteria)]|nr:hypothetical protein [Syntrophus sp. (in: bacteria)]
MRSNCRGNVLAERDGRKIIKCQECGFSHVYPMFDEEELEKFYENVYAESTPSYLWFEKVQNIRKWKKPGSILDIGCWEGKQLEYFIQDGWQCEGTELNKKAAAVAMSRGVEVYQISIREFFNRYNYKTWDVINAAYILEHIPDPLQFLVSIKNNLGEDGILIVEVPNEFSPFQLAYIKETLIEPYWIALPDHLNYFDREGLETLLSRAGFKIIHGEASFPMEMFLLMGDNYLADRVIGKKDFAKVVEMERVLRNHDPGLVSQLYTALYQCSVGRSIVLYAKPVKH